MPLFRRRQASDAGFTVGVDGHRVLLGRSGGCEMLDEIDGYIGAIAQRASTRPDGRDAIAVLNAKMDYAEMVDATLLVLLLTCEELVERGVMAHDDVPPPPRREPMARDLATYDYIQELYRRSVERMQWVHLVDALLRERNITVLRPEPAAAGTR